MAADAARRAGGVVLDLRDNPGGLLDEAVSVASVFLDGGPVVSYERRGSRPPQTLDAFAGGDVATPLVVLVDPSTASAAEVVAARCRTATAPSSSAPHLRQGLRAGAVPLSDGSALELTVGRYLTPSAGRSTASASSRTSWCPPRRARRWPSGGRSRCSPGWSPRSARTR